jgi:hypothetical protein
MQDDQQQQNSETNETSSDPLETSQKNVTAIEHSNDYTEKKDTTSESKPEMCGTLLLWIGADKMKQLQRKESRESSEEGITQ